MYLSEMCIQNFRGIQSMKLRFNPDINVIIGENGAHKSTIVDAIRLLYSLGEPGREIVVRNEDFHVDPNTGDIADEINISFKFQGLTDKEKGALYEYMVCEKEESYAMISISYTRREEGYPRFDYHTGLYSGQRANPGTFDIFQHYYLGALRDSTYDLLNTRRNLLGRVIRRSIERRKSEAGYESIVRRANEELLRQDEVTETKQAINSNITTIHRKAPNIDLHIEQTKLDYIVNLIKPFLPFGVNSDVGLNLSQNSLGFNNLIYIATVLGDMTDRVDSEDVIHFALLIEEPEAHLHPQLQLNLYNFLKVKNCPKNCQMFITTHSPTLTSKVELDSLLLIDGDEAKCIGNCFSGRESEQILQNGKRLNASDYSTKKKMLERYIDVTKSQLFFAKAVLMVEGISEELLISTFAQIDGFRLEQYDIELIQTGTSFYPFLLLFNSTDGTKRIKKRVAVITDDDRFAASGKTEYGFDEIVKNDFSKLDELALNIEGGMESARLQNLEEMQAGHDEIRIFKAYKTLEFEIALSNVPSRKKDIPGNLFVQYARDSSSKGKFEYIDRYIDSLSDDLGEFIRRRIAILLWKLITDKAQFAQDFSTFIIGKLGKPTFDFSLPSYIHEALSHLRKG